ncbi:DNA-binding LacI/PurR family transcriptional regulator [Paenarthrobacter nicotinovorans]|uniref:DNA-binding LacI/PurR family transcriptional regulator n=1 Tax=Paenarthrobacter nicotinovorans TaxID=29320 RepID=A0ABT9TTP0_PAENI|nr:LacI family DNA-binding transcriptional regulator [Paenarthrobacter nicotinovorans]MDQ0104790.1 DNA-binding LacI/PurR family transcriptional regulator [Paenarthrobacter nicotinovorans]
MTTIQDVAAAAGVSRQTVSNVLNSPAIVRPGTREKVEAAVAALGYRPHASARRLRTQKSATIGIRLDPLAADGISGSILDRFLRALTERADRRNLRVLLYTAADATEEIHQFKRLREGADVDAFVLTSTFHGDPRTRWLIENSHPFVTFGRPWGADDETDPQHPWVDVNGRHGISQATTHLLNTGLRRVAYIGWPSPSGTGDDRRMGWRHAMEQSSGLNPGLIASMSAAVDDGVVSGAQAMRELESKFREIDAVVCASDALALGAFMQSGGLIPITGYDNTPVSSSIGISSVDQPIEEVAEGVLELLLGGRNGHAYPEAPGGQPTHRLLEPRLIVRAPLVKVIPTR